MLMILALAIAVVGCALGFMLGGAEGGAVR